MYKAKVTFMLALWFALLLSACVQGVEYTPPPGLTPVPATDFPQQAVTSEPGVIVVTAQPASIGYANNLVGYKLSLPVDWRIDESGLTSCLNKEVIFAPPDAEPYIAYLSISLEFRTLDQIINLYTQSVPDATKEDTLFNGYSGTKYTYMNQNKVYRVEYFIPNADAFLLIATDRPDDSIVQSILKSIQLMTVEQQGAREATLADNGKTFILDVGCKLILRLDTGYDWSEITVSNPAVITSLKDTFQALASGSSTLTAIGNPKCLSSTPPCGMPSVSFTITLVVP